MIEYYDESGTINSSLNEDNSICKKSGNSYFVRKSNKDDSYLKKGEFTPSNYSRLRGGKPNTTFRKVSKNQFESYVEYLKTGKMLHYNIASRED